MTETHRSLPSLVQWFLSYILYRPPMGAITPLYVATSSKLTKVDNRKYFIPWAREAPPSKEVQDLALAERLWLTCECSFFTRVSTFVVN